MIMTLIDDDNIRYFEAVIGERYSEKNENELYAGVIDDAGEAVAAGIFVDTPDGPDVDFIAVSDDRRRQGIGSFLLREMKTVCKKSGIGSMHATLFTEKEEAASDAIFLFLKKNGFEMNELDARRSVYDLYRLMSLKPFATTALKRPYTIKSVAELSEKDKGKICGKLDSEENNLVDPQKVISFENRYGGILFEKDEPRAMIAAEHFYGGVHILSLYGDGDGLRMFPYLFDHVKEAVRREGMELDELVIDTVGEKMAAFEERFMSGHDVDAVRRYQVYDAMLKL